MDKIIQPWGYGHADRFPYLFETLDPYSVRHGQMRKLAFESKLHPQIKEFSESKIGTKEYPIDKDKFIYIVCSNMGAGESWGPNINADIFTRAVLSHTGTDWGTNTFKNAGIYTHHKNKDPSKSYGKVIEVVFASAPIYMDRVESVLQIDIEKALKVGAEEVVQTLRKGEYPAWSMGAKVPYDTCTVCGNHARTRADYCSHMKRHPRSIITRELLESEDFRGISSDQIGQIVAVYNPEPKFFDFSRVWVGAAAEAKTLSKIASAAGQVMTSAELSDLLKEAEKSKKADIDKRINPETTAPVGRTISLLSKKEEEIPKKLLDMSKEVGLPPMLSSLASMGMVARPSEFQRMFLSSMNRSDLADRMDEDRQVFRFSPHVDSENMHTMLARDHFLSAIANMFLSMVPKRSCFASPLIRRMAVIRITRPSPMEEDNKEVDLDKIAAMYNGYRLALIEKVAQDATQDVYRFPKLASAIFEEDFSDMSAGLRKEAMPLLDKTSAAYLLFAHGWSPTILKDADRYTGFIQNHLTRF